MLSGRHLPELQGRLPIRVELKALTVSDFRRILTEPEASIAQPVWRTAITSEWSPKIDSA